EPHPLQPHHGRGRRHLELRHRPAERRPFVRHRNLLQKGPNADNSTMVIYGEEGLSNPDHGLYIVNNTLVNNFGSGTFVDAGGSTATVQNNLFVGNGTLVSGGPATQTSNLRTSAPNFVNLGA